MHLLTELTTTLVDDDVRQAVLNATTSEQILDLLSGEKPSAEEQDNLDTNAPTIVCCDGLPCRYCTHLYGSRVPRKNGEKTGLQRSC